MTSVPKNVMMKRINAFINKTIKQFNGGPSGMEVDKPIVENQLDWDEDSKTNGIIIRTDGLFYELIYDPSIGDPITYIWHTKFYDIVKKSGWQVENQGQGVILVYDW